jgi:hypothetical protein
MSDELRDLRAAVYNLATADWIKRTDEEWYDELWKLLDPVIDARAERQLNAAVNAVSDPARNAERCPATWNPGVWPYTTRCAMDVSHTGGQPGRHVDRHDRVFVEQPTRKNWGVAWFSRTGQNGSCERCGRGGRVYQGYNGGAHVGLFCAECQRAVLRNEA